MRLGHVFGISFELSENRDSLDKSTGGQHHGSQECEFQETAGSMPASKVDRVPAVTRAVRILRHIAQCSDGSNLSDLSRAVDAPKSSVLNVCNALLSERLLDRDTAGNYSLGLRIAEFAFSQAAQSPRLTSIGIATQGVHNPFFVEEQKGVVTSAHARDIRTTVLNAGRSLKTQIDQLRNFSREDVDVVLVDAVDSNGIAPGIEALHRRGKLVIAMNAGAMGCDSTVTTDNVEAGQLVGRYLNELLPDQAEVAIIGGNPVSGVFDRIVGFLSAVREQEQLLVVDREDGDQTEEGGYLATGKILQRQSKLRAIFAINDPTAIGAAKALREQGRDLFIVSVDGSSQAIEMIRQQNYIIATAAQDPRAIGETAVALAELLFAGTAMHNRFHALPPRLITHANLNSYRPWG